MNSHLQQEGVSGRTYSKTMKDALLPRYRRITVALSLLVWATASMAVTVHTWVDADGVRHFADAPPADGAPDSVSEITLDGGDALAPSDADYYSISNQWERLRAEREAQNTLDLERRRIDAEQADPAPPPVSADVPRSVFYPNYYGLPPRFGPLYPRPHHERGPPSPRNAYVNTPPPVWPRER